MNGRCSPPSHVAWPAVSSASGWKRSSQRTIPKAPSPEIPACTSAFPDARAYRESTSRLCRLSKQSTSRSISRQSASTLSARSRTPNASALMPKKLWSWSFSASALFRPIDCFTYACARTFFDSTRSKSTNARVASTFRQNIAAVEPSAPTPQNRIRMTSRAERDLRSQIEARLAVRALESVDHEVRERVFREVRNLQAGQCASPHQLHRDATHVGVRNVRIELERAVGGEAVVGDVQSCH